MQIFTTILISVVSFLLGAVIKWKFDRCNYMHEKRRDAYTELINACILAIKYAQHKCALSQAFEEGLPPITTEMGVAFEQADGMIEAARERKTFILGKKAAACLEKFQNRSRILDETDQHGEFRYWESEIQHYSELKLELIDAAK